MFDLTKRERVVIIFLSLSLLVGSGILYYRKANSRVELKVLPLDAKTEKLLRESRLVKINEATLRALIKLPGIGPVLARRIIDHRNLHGPFQKVEDIKNVRGTGGEKFEQIRELLVIE